MRCPATTWRTAAAAWQAHGRPRRHLARTAALVAAAVVAAAPSTAGARPKGDSWRAPARLAETGLYSDFAARTIDPQNLAYSPQYPLWSDGAEKRRWIFLPRGRAIDARDPERWRFPVGTKLWKEFSWGRRVETRYLERTREGWRYAAYAWRDDGSDAVLASERGAATDQEVAPGKCHRIPSVEDCKSCHEGGRSEVLGFTALQLSPDRDPLAPHREPLEPGMVTLRTLVERGLLRHLPKALLEEPPRIVAATARGRAALGYLHANCSSCHDEVGPMASLGVSMFHSLAARTPEDAPAIAAVGRPSAFQVTRRPGAKNAWIDPGSPSSSAVAVRMGSRDAAAQMPPVGTQVVDEAAVTLVRAWIEQDLAAARATSRGPGR
jgi:hypothetical protein